MLYELPMNEFYKNWKNEFHEKEVCPIFIKHVYREPYSMIICFRKLIDNQKAPYVSLISKIMSQ